MPCKIDLFDLQLILNTKSNGHVSKRKIRTTGSTYKHHHGDACMFLAFCDHQKSGHAHSWRNLHVPRVPKTFRPCGKLPYIWFVCSSVRLPPNGNRRVENKERILTEYLVSHASLETYAFKTLRGTQISVHFYLLSHGVIISESKPIPFFRMRRPPLYLFEKQWPRVKNSTPLFIF